MSFRWIAFRREWRYRSEAFKKLTFVLRIGSDVRVRRLSFGGYAAGKDATRTLRLFWIPSQFARLSREDIRIFPRTVLELPALPVKQAIIVVGFLAESETYSFFKGEGVPYQAPARKERAAALSVLVGQELSAYSEPSAIRDALDTLYFSGAFSGVQGDSARRLGRVG